MRIGLIVLIAFEFSSFYGGFLAFLAFENKSSNASLDPFPPGPTASSDQGVCPNKNAHLLIGRALTFPVVKYFPGMHVFRRNYAIFCDGGECPFQGNRFSKMIILETKYHKNLHFLDLFIFCVSSLFIPSWRLVIFWHQN